MQVALSTMWGVGRFVSLGEFFTAASALGFSQFELNHAVDSAMLRDLNLDGFGISSVHEPCPADVSVSTLRSRNWLISAPDEVNRRQGVAAIKRSIDLAYRMKARAVIVHPGKVDIDSLSEDKLRTMFREGSAGAHDYRALKEEYNAARAARADQNLASVHKSLGELVEYAGPLGIRLGLENRYHFHEIPSPDELDELLDQKFGEVVGFWYDVGHAETLDRLGFYAHEDWLKRFSSRIIGVHLHDIVDLDDHQAVESGHIDWEMISRHLPQAALRTCEFRNSSSPEQLLAAVKWLTERGCLSS